MIGAYIFLGLMFISFVITLVDFAVHPEYIYGGSYEKED